MSETYFEIHQRTKVSGLINRHDKAKEKQNANKY